MGDVSKQFSLREIIGNVAPGAMALSAILWVWLKVATLPSSGYPLGDVLIGFVLAYGAGTLLTSLTQNIFAAVTQFRTGSATGAHPQRLVLRRAPSETVARSRSTCSR